MKYTEEYVVDHHWWCPWRRRRPMWTPPFPFRIASSNYSNGMPDGWWKSISAGTVYLDFQSEGIVYSGIWEGAHRKSQYRVDSPFALTVWGEDPSDIYKGRNLIWGVVHSWEEPVMANRISMLGSGCVWMESRKFFPDPLVEEKGAHRSILYQRWTGSMVK